MARSLRPALLFLALAAGCGGQKAPTSVVPVTTSTFPTAEPVRDAFLHAWQGYRRYAWGHDDLDPLSRKPHDWYGVPLLMTPVDA